MSERESDFLNDVENAVSCWSYTSDSYHEDGGFIVEITIDDDDEWAEDEDEIWNSLSEVADDWDACLDSDCSTYYVSIEAD